MRAIKMSRNHFLVVFLTSCGSLLLPSTTFAQLLAPRVQVAPAAEYPKDAVAQRLAGTVVVLATVNEQGQVVNAKVVSSAGSVLDSAALDNIRKWIFVPASQDGKAIISDVRIPITFELPPLETPQPPSPALEQKPVALTEEDDHDAASFESIVHGKRHPPRSSSDFIFEKAVLNVAPKTNAGDLLNIAPGVTMSRPEGDGVAHEIIMRGFDAEHGQDVEFTLGAIPINQPSHIHAQGYADLNFIIPETIRTLRVIEGTFDPTQSDFAVAGSVNFDLAVEKRGYYLASAYGSFGTSRSVVLWAPEHEEEETFAAVSLNKTSGFGERRRSFSASALGQYALDLGNSTHILLFVGSYGNKSALPGVLRRDDYENNHVGFYDAYSDLSAQKQNIYNTRHQLALDVTHGHLNGSKIGLTLWTLAQDFRLRENLTGFTETLPGQNIAPGDFTEETNEQLGIGAKFYARSQTYAWNAISGKFEIGLQTRTDRISQTQNSLTVPSYVAWEHVLDQDVRAHHVGLYADADVSYKDRVRLHGGLRTDAFAYRVSDRLTSSNNRTPIANTAAAFTAAPRLTLEWKVLQDFSVLAAYGEGFRSPQALLIREGQHAQLARVRTAEIGSEYLPIAGWAKIHIAFHWTRLTNELTFDAHEGKLESIGPSRRLGAAAYLTLTPQPWLSSVISATYVRGILEDPPADGLETPYKKGQKIPNVPPLIARADLKLQKTIWTFDTRPLVGSVGITGRYVAERPLAFDMRTKAYALADTRLSLAWSILDVALDVSNVFNERYTTSAFVFESQWRNDPSLRSIPQKHFAAGAPRTFMVSLALSL